MTDESKQIERQRKEDLVSALQAEWPYLKRKPDIKAGLDTDDRIRLYVEEVVNNPQRHNYYEIASVRRFCNMLCRHDWKPKRVRKFFEFYETLRFNGANGRQSYKLTPIQCFQFANIFGFVDAEGNRLIRTAYLFVPRKFSKTTSAASLAVYDMLAGDSNAQAYIGANSYEQAKICFNEIRSIMRDLDSDEETFQINREKITFKIPGRDSFIRCLTANARTQDGLNASLVIMDEYAQARNTAGKNGADLKNVLTSSMGVRRSPLTVIITTASEVVDGPFAHELEGVKAILRGEVENDTVFASLFMPDVDDKENDPATWRKVQPHLGVTVREDFYEKEYANAQLSAENMLTFRTKLLNIFCVNEQKTWLPASLIKEHSAHIDIEEFSEGTPCTIAFDLSVRDDFSAVTFAFFDEDKFTQYYKTYYFIPRGGYENHRNKALYAKWHEEGHLIIQEGEVIDYEAIADFILEKAGERNVIAVTYDRAKSRELVNMLMATDLGPVVKECVQTMMMFTSPVQSFEAGVRTGHIVIDDNPINAYCFGNAVLVHDNNDNAKPFKRAQNDKIDGAITMLMALRAFNETPRYLI